MKLHVKWWQWHTAAGNQAIRLIPDGYDTPVWIIVNAGQPDVIEYGCLTYHALETRFQIFHG